VNTPDPNAVVGASNAAPGLDPQTIMSAAITNQTHEATVGTATATAGYGTATTQAQALSTLSQSQQRAVWGKASADQQTQWQSVGYNPPAAPVQTKTSGTPGGGIFSDVMGAADKVGSIAGKGVSEALHVANVPLSTVLHTERAGHVLSEMQMGEDGMTQQQIGQKAQGSGWDPFAGIGKMILSPSAWSQAWRETQNGEKTFDPAIVANIRASADPQKFGIAKQLAQAPNGADTSTLEKSIVDSYPQAQQQNVAQMIASDPDIKNLTAQLQAAKMSPGRELVGSKALVDHPALGKVISGGIDAALDYAQDPTMQLGKAQKVADAANWGIDSARAEMYNAGNATDWVSTVDSLAGKSAVQRHFAQIADAVNKDGWEAAVAKDPRLGTYYQGMAKDLGGNVTSDSIKDWYASQAGMSAVLSGKAAASAQGVAMFPHLSVMGAARADIRGALTKTIDFANDIDKDPEKVAEALKQAKLTIHDLAGTTHDLMAHDGSLPEDASQVATMTATPTTMLNKADVAKDGGFATSVVRGGIAKVGRVMKQMTTLTTDVPYVDLASDDGAIQLRRMLQYSLPSYAVNHIMDLYTATPDIDKRFGIVKSSVDQMLHLAGVYSTDDSESGSKIMDALEQSFHGESYAPGDIAQMQGRGHQAAVLENQLNHRVFLPEFHKVHAAVLQHAFMSSIRVPLNNLAERTMNLWRAGVLLRPGFPLRTSIDENLGSILRNGLGPTIAAHMATRQARHGLLREAQAGIRGDAEREAARDSVPAVDGIEKSVLPHQGPLAKATQVLTSRLDPEIVDKIRTTRDLAGAVLGNAAWKVVTPFSRGLTRQDLMERAADMHDHVWDAVSPMVSALAHSGGGYDEGDSLLKMMHEGKPTYMTFRNGKTYSAFGPGDTFAKQRWQVQLDQVADSKLAQRVMKDIDKPQIEQVKNVMAMLNDPDFADTKKLFERNSELPDGSVVGVSPGVTQKMATRAHARAIVAMVNATVRSGNPETGPIIRQLVSVMREGDHVSPDIIDSVEHFPAQMFGPDIVPVVKTQDLVEKGFTPLSRMMDNLSRQPIFLQQFAQAYKQVLPWAEKLHPLVDGVDEEARNAAIKEDASQMAADNAMSQMKPYVHSPEIRSQFEVLHRTAMPFLFAQDQFAKRWLRTFATNPAAIEKAQLAMNGLRTSGVIHTDANGNEFFYYPGSQYVTSTLAHAANAIGIPSYLTIQIPFTGQVKYLMPGISDPLTPSVGPTVAIPLKALTGRFPELQNADQAMLGAGASNSYWEQIMPSTLSRVVHAISDNPDQPGQLSSAMMQAMQQLQSTGHGLNPGSTTAQKQAYIDRVTNWARIYLFSKAIVGFAAPASPEGLFDPSNYSTRLQTLLSELPYDQAMSEFMKEDPNATPYTVFDSKSTGGASLPATQAAGDFINKNANFVQTYSQAAGWLIPRTTGNQPFDSSVYREQIQYGMRDSKAATELGGGSTFLNDVMVAPAAKQYWAAYDKEQSQLASASNASEKAAIRSTYDQQKSLFMAQNPTFADTINSSTAKATREQTIYQLEDALTDPNVPKGPQTDHVREMITKFDQYQQQDLQLQGQSSATASRVRTALKSQFVSWATNYATAHADVSDLWTTLLTPEITDTTSGLGSTTSAQTLTDTTPVQSQAPFAQNITTAPPATATPAALAVAQGSA
jgi:hypothetical protein